MAILQISINDRQEIGDFMLLVSCSTSQEFLSQSLKLTVIPNEKCCLPLQNSGNEVMAGLDLSQEFVGGIDRRVDFAAQSRLGVRQCGHDLAEGHAANHHHVDIAVCACRRPCAAEP